MENSETAIQLLLLIEESLEKGGDLSPRIYADLVALSRALIMRDLRDNE